MNLQVKLGSYDIYQARDQFYTRMNRIFESMPKDKTSISDPILQFKTITKVLDIQNSLGLEGEQFARQAIEQRIFDYVTDILVDKIQNQKESKIKTELSIIQEKYNRKKHGAPKPAQSSGQIALALRNNRKGLTPQMDGLHVIMNPINFFTDTQGIDKYLDIKEEISNNLKAYYNFIKKKPNHGFTISLLKEHKEKYKQLTSFFYEKFSIECISFDFMFDGKIFKEFCTDGNPFDQGIMSYLDLSSEYAMLTLNFNDPKFEIANYSEKDIANIKSENIWQMRQNSHLNLDVFLELIANSKKVKELTKINFSGVMMTNSALTQLNRIIENGNVMYLNLAGCSFSTEGLKILQECLKNGKKLEIIVLDDIIKHYYHRVSDSEAHSLLQEISLASTNLKELYFNWNNIHKFYNTYKKTATKDYMRDISLKQLDKGPLAKQCLDALITIILSKNNIRFLQIRNNMIPFELVQSIAIALKSQRSIQELDVSGNKDFFDMNGDPTCWQRLFSCKFFDKICFYKYCCACCCASSVQFGNRLVNSEVLDDIKSSSQKHNNNPTYNLMHEQISNKYKCYTEELDKQKRLQKKRELEDERQKQLKKEQEEKDRKEKEEKEYNLKLKLAEVGASKTVNQITLNNETRSDKIKVSNVQNPIIPSVIGIRSALGLPSEGADIKAITQANNNVRDTEISNNITDNKNLESTVKTQSNTNTDTQANSVQKQENLPSVIVLPATLPTLPATLPTLEGETNREKEEEQDNLIHPS